MPATLSLAFPPCSEQQRQAFACEHKTHSKEHGRIITRHLQASTRIVPHLNWPGLAQVLCLKRTTKRSGKLTEETHYAITSLSPDRAGAAELMKLWRDHWHIENRLHWVRDTAFHEDKCRIRHGGLGQIMAGVRNAAINLLRLQQVTNITAELRQNAYQTDRLLSRLGMVKKE